MQRVRVCVELSDADYRAYEDEARRREVSVEVLVQQMVQALVQDLKREERESTDHPVFLP